MRLCLGVQLREDHGRVPSSIIDVSLMLCRWFINTRHSAFRHRVQGRAHPIHHPVYPSRDIMISLRPHTDHCHQYSRVGVPAAAPAPAPEPDHVFALDRPRQLAVLDYGDASLQRQPVVCRARAVGHPERRCPPGDVQDDPSQQGRWRREPGAVPQDAIRFKADATGIVECGAGPLGVSPTEMPTNIRVPQHYPFIPRARASHNTLPPLVPSGSTSAASGGAYACTYPGCGRGFNTLWLLQKHERLGHRQPRSHLCDRIKPSTGRPCLTLFRRRYELTRHQDTVHNIGKMRVRCNLCAEKRTFSRPDALIRHYRVFHPGVEAPNKRQRGG